MPRHSKPFNLLLILALLLGTGQPLLHAASAGEGFWTTSCKGKALFVPLAQEAHPEQMRCLICLADNSDEFALIASRSDLAIIQPATATLAGLVSGPALSSDEKNQPIRAPPAADLRS
jgi:hypothetical protein